MIFRIQLFIFALFFITSVSIHAQETPTAQSEETGQIAEQHPVKVELVLEEETIQPGRPFWAAIHLKHQEHWHTYWKNPGDSGMPTAVEWTLPEGFTANPIVWPTPKKFVVNEAVGYGYENDTVLLIQLTPPQTLPQSTDSIALSANFRWVVCSDAQCIMGESSTSAELKMTAAAPKANAETAPVFAHARQQLPEKHENVQASRKGNHIELHFQLPEGTVDHHQHKISFFPENNDVIDHAMEPIPFEGAQASNDYTIFLKSSANLQEKDLKGLVVIQDSTTTVSHSLEIQAPITGSAQNDVISMAEIPGKNEQLMGTSSHMAALPSVESEFEGGLGLALLLAFAGGMILNLMPCVLPVISFKILSFVKLAGQSRVLTFKHGLAFSAGVLASFWVLAGVLLVLQTYGHTVGWGFQLQEPIFVGILSAILLVFALSQFGIFEMGTSMTSWAGQAEAAHRSNGFVGSFFGGVLATAVATPCTGPFLGTAVGFAVTLPTILAMLMFTSLGLGMAAPYLVLTAYPRLLRFLPKPGAWMVTFKEIVGFFMLATVLWLLWVFGAQTDSLAVFMLLIGFFCLALGCWIYGKWGASLSSKTARHIGRTLTAVCFIAGSYIIISAAAPQNVALHETKHEIANADSAHGTDTWETFSPERVAELHSKGIPVLVDFTAKWCLICQANHLVFSNSDVNAMLNKLGVVKMKADWTRRDMVITQELRKFGRNSVPLYLLYGKNPSDQPQILPQVLTPATVIEHLEKV